MSSLCEMPGCRRAAVVLVRGETCHVALCAEHGRAPALAAPSVAAPMVERRGAGRLPALAHGTYQESYRPRFVRVGAAIMRGGA